MDGRTVQPSDRYDVVVIGGGVVGCAIVYQLSLRGYRCLLAEKEDVLLSGSSAGNSGMVHCGFDAVPGTIEADCLKESVQIEAVCSDLKIPYKKIGAIMIAQNESQLLELDEMEQNAKRNRVFNLKRLTRDDVLRLEPNLNANLIFGGLLIPDEGVVDSWLLPVSMAHCAVRHGAKVELGCEITSGRLMADNSWSLNSSGHKILKAAVVVNAAGLYGDQVEEICQPSSFHIHPRKGQFIVYEPKAGQLIKHVIFPLPSEKSKGILVYPSVYGNLVVGPTADDCTERSNPVLTDAVTEMLREYGQNLVPSLAKYKIIETYAGIRPATQSIDYHIRCNKDRRWVTVGGIRSTGVTCSVSIATRICQMIQEQLHVAPNAALHSEQKRETDGQNAIKTREELVVNRLASSDGKCVRMDGVQYAVTHPLSRIGLQFNGIHHL